MVINSKEDIRKTINKARKPYLKRGEQIYKVEIDRLIKLYNIIKANAPLKNRYIDLGEWFFPLFYLEVTDKSGKYEYPDYHRIALSYNVKTGTIMDEVIDGRKSGNFHGCIRKGFYKVLKVIERELDTKITIPIKT